MTDIWDVVSQDVSHLQKRLHPLYIIAGKPDSGKTDMAKRLEKEGLVVYVNLSLNVAHCLLRQDDMLPLDVNKLLMCCPQTDLYRPLLFDNIELLFTLKIQIIPFFQEVSRHHPAVVIWPDEVHGGIFHYSAPNMDDYYYFLDSTVMVINLKKKNGGDL